jgi:UDP-N-acetylglucosamine--N-acetylmuramyl-(pentapeptide) pyrophosphoryl-undecaprenol N-acetylglucosamine transferase
MSTALSFLMAGGGTGGHVIPALAVARELRRRGHRPFFVGTRQGIEARLVPADGYIRWIEIRLKRVGRPKRCAAGSCRGRSARPGVLRTRRPAAVFSMGRYAGPAMLAAWLPACMVMMEPNAVAG